MSSATLHTQLHSFYHVVTHLPFPMLEGFMRRHLRRHDVVQQEIRLHDVYLNYYHLAQRTGPPNGLPIVLIHGIADSALTWAFIIEKLADGHDVYAVDLPGYGFSTLPPGRAYATLDDMRDLLSAFVREVVGRPALVVGNSLGGWLAIKLAWSDPQLICGIVLLNPGGAPLGGREAWAPFQKLIQVPDLKTARLVFRQLFHRMPPPLVWIGQHGLQQSFQRQVLQEFAQLLKEDEFLQPYELRTIPVPTAMVWGLSDTFLPSGSLEFFQENLPEAALLLLERCGHLPQRERPGRVAAFVLAFAARAAERAQAERDAGYALTEDSH